MTRFIEIKDEQGQLTRVELTGEELVIGRSSSADLRLNRPTVSRKHARLSLANGAWTITDLDSTSGTSLNDRPIKQSEIKPGDVLRISRFELRLIDPAQSSLSDRFGMTTMWAQEQAPPQLSALDFGPPPQIDFALISSVNEFGQALMEEDGPEARLDLLCRTAVAPEMGGNWSLVLEASDGQADEAPAILAASDPRLIKHQGIHISQTAIRAVLRDQAPVLANNYGPESEAVDMSIVAGADAAAAVICPLGGEAGVQRMLYVNLPPQRGSVTWLAVMTLLAKAYQQAEAERRTREDEQQRAAVERDMQNAKEIQRSILPSDQSVEGLDIAWSFVPCDAVGGDLIDVIPTPDGKVLVAIADVSGHGLAAALATLSIHSILQTATKSGTTAEQMMTMLNEHLCAYLPDSRFVTMSTLVIDPATGETACINAGHHAPMVIDAHGATRELNNEGHLVLGVAPSEMTAATDQLQPGETMLLYTDGLIEMNAPEGGMLQSAGLTRLFTEALESNEHVSQVKTSLRQSLDQVQADQPALDDQTFMVLRRG
ncbi:MAG: SpoIIE family protein phosphatase [Planctomycetota bacterium]